MCDGAAISAPPVVAPDRWRSLADGTAEPSPRRSRSNCHHWLLDPGPVLSSGWAGSLAVRDRTRRPEPGGDPFGRQTFIVPFELVPMSSTEREERPRGGRDARVGSCREQFHAFRGVVAPPARVRIRGPDERAEREVVRRAEVAYRPLKDPSHRITPPSPAMVRIRSGGTRRRVLYRATLGYVEAPLSPQNGKVARPRPACSRGRTRWVPEHRRVERAMP
jgi:hypothetical protein